jgi:D-arabinono-1,4-lactone oxidase
MQVVVNAGCHLGRDPRDPYSSLQNSLVYQLNQKGWAVKDLGGITHQTIGGFVATGSSGGSFTHSFHDAIVGIRIINGMGEPRDYPRPDNDPDHNDEFYGVVVSMGLLGIISTVTLQCTKSFNIIGKQVTSTIADCEIDLFGEGRGDKESLEQFLKKTEYTRLLWWPQAGVEKIVVWDARKMEPKDYNREDCCGDRPDRGTSQALRPKPYREFPLIDDSVLPIEAAGFFFYSIVGKWPDSLRVILNMLLSRPQAQRPSRRPLQWILYKFVKFIVENLYSRKILPQVLNFFVSDDGVCPDYPDRTQPKEFWDLWWHGLPMDYEANDKLLATEFTEMWIPISQTGAVMRTLRDYYRQNGLLATRSYCCEIYAAKKSDFWMSPANLDGTSEEGVVRVDIFWFKYNNANPDTDYYPRFWNLLAKFNYKLHWGKHLPVDSADRLSKVYGKWRSFMELRKTMDPGDVFLTPYWQSHVVETEGRGVQPVPAVKEASAPKKKGRFITFEKVMKFTAGVAGLLGILLAFKAELLATIFGANLGSSGIWVCNLLGASEIGFGVLSWQSRNLTEPSVRKKILVCFLLVDGLGAYFGVRAQLAHPPAFNVGGWFIVGLYSFLALIFALELYLGWDEYKPIVV